MQEEQALDDIGVPGEESEAGDGEDESEGSGETAEDGSLADAPAAEAELSEAEETQAEIPIASAPSETKEAQAEIPLASAPSEAKEAQAEIPAPVASAVAEVPECKQRPECVIEIEDDDEPGLLTTPNPKGWHSNDGSGEKQERLRSLKARLHDLKFLDRITEPTHGCCLRCHITPAPISCSPKAAHFFCQAQNAVAEDGPGLADLCSQPQSLSTDSVGSGFLDRCVFRCRGSHVSREFYKA